MYFGKMINKVSEIEGSYGIASVNYISLVFSDRIYFSVFSVSFPYHRTYYKRNICYCAYFLADVFGLVFDLWSLKQRVWRPNPSLHL